MTRSRSLRLPVRRAALAALAVLAGLAVWLPAGVVPAGAQTPTLGVNPVVLPAGQPSTVTVLGSGYLVPPHAANKNVFGGVYVLFGWVVPGSTWGPSSRNATDTNGQYGITYSYAGISRGADTRDDGTGNNRFVSFTSGGISGESTDFHMTMDPAYPDNSRGSWATTITVPGHTYQWVDPATGASSTVDCLQVQCGIYTIGAHGVASVTNERFTPITFTTGGGAAPAPVVTAAPPSGTSSTGGGSSSATGGSATVGGTSTGRSPATTKPVATTVAPATPTTAVPESTSVPDSTTTVPETTTTTSIALSTTRRTGGDSESLASDRVIVFEGADDGPGALVWVAGAGLPLVATAGLVVRRRRRSTL